ncbi:hypothetical protein ABFS82_08G196500 [Erythranthe guttata]|uniref:Cytochrome P450 n=2 Tax=Erythranthe guttata TaxID=4155 RepID=A0A022QG86_ERYGU|nr:hypothetical protein MIMGU_mgv1a019274mg [Erythranthe guttata]
MAVITLSIILTSIVVAASITWAVKLLNWVWFRPRKLEKILRQQGLNGNPYRPFLGDLGDMIKFMKAEQPKTIELFDDILPHIFAYYHQIVTKYGENSFIWFGPWPRLNVSDPELIKEILSKPDIFHKPLPETAKILIGGMLLLEGDKWSKHRKIVTPAFHLEKLKNMVPAIGLSCSNMVQKLKEIVSSRNEGGFEIDMWPYIDDLTGDMISRTAFGSSYEEGRKIFQLQKERVKLTLPLLQFSFIPGWRHVPTKVNRKVKAISNEIQSILRCIIEKRHKSATKTGENGVFFGDDLLGLMMESNARFTREEGNANEGMSIEEVIEECKLFYFAGSETTSGLLVWTMVLLCKHPEWQTQAREEVMRVFGNSEPNFLGLSHLKTVTMILQEVLRLYSPAPLTVRAPTETVKLGNMTIPLGVHLSLLISQVHCDPDIWGDDAKEFNPKRFSEGVSNATKIQSSFLPFSSGPRICLGHTFAMIEAKMALAMILKHFSFELSPSYLHAPFAVITLQPQYGAPMILRSLEPL